MYRDYKSIIEEFQILVEKGGYIFRGHPNACYHLQPKAFRQKELSSFKNEKLQINIENWVKTEQFRKLVEAETLTSIQNNFVILRNIVKLVYFIMQYNYSLYDFYSKFPTAINYNDEHLIKLVGSSGYWLEEKTFFDLFSDYLRNSMTIWVEKDGKILRQPNLSEIFTGVDETYPQHYEQSTATLDWTYDPIVALFFACRELDVRLKKDSNLYVCEKIPAKYLAIFAYKETTDRQNKYFTIVAKDKFKKNLRAERQHGTFMIFPAAAYFYIQNGEFPIMETYIKEGNFETIKFIIEKTEKNMKELKIYLKQVGADEDYLYPN